MQSLLIEVMLRLLILVKMFVLLSTGSRKYDPFIFSTFVSSWMILGSRKPLLIFGSTKTTHAILRTVEIYVIN